MPPKTIAGLLNNESNLRILEKLKERPFYPRELAAEMKLSEPFIVRRLKAMEEHDIVEGRWESENGRKVKRYYVKDVTMQLGKAGLEVRSATAPAPVEFDLLKEILKFLIGISLVVLPIFGVLIGQPAIVAAGCLLIAWQVVVNAALYRRYHSKTLITSIFLLALCILIFTLLTATMLAPHNLISDSGETGYLYMAFGMAFLIAFLYHIRFSQAELDHWKRDRRDFASGLEAAATPVKIFYLPFVLAWRANEYFGLA